MKEGRVLSGMRPTGRLHLGHLFGALENWKRLQAEYHCYFFVADWHALTSDYADPSHLREYTREIVLDWLSAGIDPEKAVLFIQSRLPEHAELHLLLSMITPLPWLERNPTRIGVCLNPLPCTNPRASRGAYGTRRSCLCSVPSYVIISSSSAPSNRPPRDALRL